jgi:hypothetical protein
VNKKHRSFSWFTVICKQGKIFCCSEINYSITPTIKLKIQSSRQGVKLNSKLKDYLFILLTIIIIIVTANMLYAPKKVIKSSAISVDQVKKVFPDAEKITPAENEKDWQSVFDRSGKQLGSVVLSSPYTDDISGYGGTTPLLIFIDTNGKIKATPSSGKSGISRLCSAGGGQWISR